MYVAQRKWARERKSWWWSVVAQCHIWRNGVLSHSLIGHERSNQSCHLHIWIALCSYPRWFERMAEMWDNNWLESLFSFVKHWEGVYRAFEARALRQGRDLFSFFNFIIESINFPKAACWEVCISLLLHLKEYPKCSNHRLTQPHTSPWLLINTSILVTTLRLKKNSADW